MMRTTVLVSLTVAMLAAGAPPRAAAQDTKSESKKSTAKTAAKPDPTLAPIEDQPGLPRVLLIGDSISMGYTLPVRELLAGKANVHRIPTNGGPTPRGLDQLDGWLGDGRWDVIHFNWGLHDLKLIDGKHQVPLDRYEKNLRELVGRLKKTGAKLIWCTTTPVPVGADGRQPLDLPAYNAAARKVMEEQRIAIDDLHGYAVTRLKDIQRPKNVHFTAKGSQVLAQQVARKIEAALAEGKGSSASASADDRRPELLSIEKIWDRGPHNAFTDLIRFRDQWFCAFRESAAHVGGDGGLRVLVSNDGRQWEPAALVVEEGIDLRDPKLSIAPDGRLMMVAGGSIYQGKEFKGRQPRVTFSDDGRTWTPPARVLDEGEWLWRVTWHEGRGYGVSYNAGPRENRKKNPTPADPRPDPDWKLQLVSTADGLHYERVCDLDVPHYPGETTLRFLDTGEMMALVRRETGSQAGWVGTSQAPYTNWQWHEIGHRLGGPNFIQLPDGSLWASSRSHSGEAKKSTTVLARLTRDSYDPVITLPSGGDTSYPGMVWHDGQLWLSYYSSHEGKSAIYLARIRIPLAKCGDG